MPQQAAESSVVHDLTGRRPLQALPRSWPRDRSLRIEATSQADHALARQPAPFLARCNRFSLQTGSQPAIITSNSKQQAAIMQRSVSTAVMASEATHHAAARRYSLLQAVRPDHGFFFLIGLFLSKEACFP